VGSQSVIAVGLLAILSVLLVYGTWMLPYRFPPQEFVIGASYEVGFNNTVSFLAYVICIGLLSLVATRLVETRIPKRGSSGSPHFADAIAAVVVLGHVLLFAVLYAYKGRFVFAEGLYFQSLLYRMATGEIPYVDFGFYYGPLMLYPAHWLGLVLGLDLAYGIWFITTYAVGLIFLYVVVRFCVKQERARAFWFVFLALGLFNPLTGLNETFTRYLFPSIVFLSSGHFFRTGGVRRGLAASAVFAAAITYSFEVAVLSIAGVLLLALALSAGPRLLRLFGMTRRAQTVLPIGPIVARAGALLCMAAAVSTIFFLAVDPSGRALREYPAIAQSYSGGAHNVPIYPHLPFIALAAVTVATLATVMRMVLRNEDELLGLAALAYAGVAVIAQRAAFGAAEPSHFAFFGLPIFCLALFLAAQWRRERAARAWLAAVLLVGIMLPMQYYHVMEFVPFFTERLPSAGSRSPQESGEDSSPRTSLEQDLRNVVRVVGTDHPYVMYEMEYSSLPVYRDFKLRYATYYTMLITARDQAGIEQVIDEVRSRQAVVVVRKENLSSLQPHRRSMGVLRWFDSLSGAHTAGSTLNEVLLKSRTRLMAPFLKFVQTEYKPIYHHNGLIAFGPR
jgi:hypothetical protein